jgi:hypothetical protein
VAEHAAAARRVLGPAERVVLQREHLDGRRVRREEHPPRPFPLPHLASPSELLASPSELLASPSELLASPSELLA